MHHVTKHLVTEKKGEVVGAMAKVRVARFGMLCSHFCVSTQ